MAITTMGVIVGRILNLTTTKTFTLSSRLKTLQFSTFPVGKSGAITGIGVLWRELLFQLLLSPLFSRRIHKWDLLVGKGSKVGMNLQMSMSFKLNKSTYSIGLNSCWNPTVILIKYASRIVVACTVSTTWMNVSGNSELGSGRETVWTSYRAAGCAHR
jgi:hypothetical protein